MTDRATTLAAVVTAALLVASGCVGGTGGGGSDDGRAEEIRQASLEAMQDVDSAAYDLDTTVETDDGRVTFDATGAVDRGERRQELDLTLSVDRGGNTQTTNVTAYVVGDTMYLRAYGQWRERPAENVWNSGTQIAKSRDLLEAVDVSLDRNETVRGEETYVLALEASDTEAVKEVLADQLSQQGNQQGLQALERAELTEFSAEMYVDRETSELRRTTMQFTLETDRGTADVEVDLVYTQVGDVSVEVPDEVPRSVRAPAASAP